MILILGSVPLLAWSLPLDSFQEFNTHQYAQMPTVQSLLLPGIYSSLVEIFTRHVYVYIYVYISSPPLYQRCPLRSMLLSFPTLAVCISSLTHAERWSPSTSSLQPWTRTPSTLRWTISVQIQLCIATTFCAHMYMYICWNSKWRDNRLHQFVVSNHNYEKYYSIHQKHARRHTLPEEQW